MNDEQLIKVRIIASGQTQMLAPAVARAMVGGGTATPFDNEEARKLEASAPRSETAALDPGERALAPQHKPPKRKSAR